MCQVDACATHVCTSRNSLTDDSHHRPNLIPQCVFQFHSNWLLSWDDGLIKLNFWSFEIWDILVLVLKRRSFFHWLVTNAFWAYTSSCYEDFFFEGRSMSEASLHQHSSSNNLIQSEKVWLSAYKWHASIVFSPFPALKICCFFLSFFSFTKIDNVSTGILTRCKKHMFCLFKWLITSIIAQHLSLKGLNK